MPRPRLFRPMTSSPYDDIIHLSRPASTRHPPMSMQERAGQFSPFAALVGYDDAVKEVGREVGCREELSPDEEEELNATLQKIGGLLAQGVRPAVRVTRFVPDESKEGGGYRTIQGVVRGIDGVEGTILLEKEAVPLRDVGRVTLEA